MRKDLNPAKQRWATLFIKVLNELLPDLSVGMQLLKPVVAEVLLSNTTEFSMNNLLEQSFPEKKAYIEAILAQCLTQILDTNDRIRPHHLCR